MKNERGQIYVLGHKKRVVQTGYFERVLCGDCESRLSAYETEFDKNWMQTLPKNISDLLHGPEPDVLTVTIPDYDKFKLFHLSVFWRAAVSSFKIDPTISLGRYERTIARMILTGDPGKPGDFPFIASLNFDGNGNPVPTVTPLAKSEDKFDDQFDCYMLSYACCDWLFVLACPAPEWLVKLEESFRSEGIFILLSSPLRESKSFNLFADALRNRKSC